MEIVAVVMFISLMIHWFGSVVSLFYKRPSETSTKKMKIISIIPESGPRLSVERKPISHNNKIFKTEPEILKRCRPSCCDKEHDFDVELIENMVDRTIPVIQLDQFIDDETSSPPCLANSDRSFLSNCKLTMRRTEQLKDICSLLESFLKSEKSDFGKDDSTVGPRKIVFSVKNYYAHPPSRNKKHQNHSSNDGKENIYTDDVSTDNTRRENPSC